MSDEKFLIEQSTHLGQLRTMLDMARIEYEVFKDRDETRVMVEGNIIAFDQYGLLVWFSNPIAVGNSAGG